MEIKSMFVDSPGFSGYVVNSMIPQPVCPECGEGIFSHSNTGINKYFHRSAFMSGSGDSFGKCSLNTTTFEPTMISGELLLELLLRKESENFPKSHIPLPPSGRVSFPKELYFPFPQKESVKNVHE